MNYSYCGRFSKHVYSLGPLQPCMSCCSLDQVHNDLFLSRHTSRNIASMRGCCAGGGVAKPFSAHRRGPTWRCVPSGRWRANTAHSQWGWISLPITMPHAPPTQSPVTSAKRTFHAGARYGVEEREGGGGGGGEEEDSGRKEDFYGHWRQNYLGIHQITH